MKMNRTQLKGLEVNKNRESIIKRYNAGVGIHILAGEFNITADTLCRRLKRWMVKIRKGDFKKKTKKNEYSRRKFSPELQARMKENTRINNKHIKFFKTVEIMGDKFLVREVLGK